MKKNPVIPYALIAVLGIVLVIVISVVGINQRDAMESDDDDADTEEQSDEDKGDEDAEEGDTDDPEDIFEDNCASCHGDDLSGDMGPNLQEVGDRHSEDEIEDIIMNGKGDMPAGLVEEDEADTLADWLADKK